MTQPRTAIVTGAARGIGAAIATRLAADGMNVAAIDLDAAACADTVSTIQAQGVQALAVACDVADETSAEQAVAQVAGEIGPPTVLVNNAGIIRDDLLFRMPVESWDMVINVHLRGAFLMTKAVQAHMTDAGWGRIVNLSSASALGNRGQANYSAAKAGIQGFTKTLAIELGRFGVTANAVAPGIIVTEMTAATAERLGMSVDAFVEQVLPRIPVGRAGTAEDVAHTVSFLASEGSSYLSGQVLYLAGGPLD